jgi:protocatechuate 3,4-dioxygenase alpha subunit
VTLPETPSQTIGPFYAVGLPWPDGPDVVPEGTPEAVRVAGRVLDGAGEPVPDALVETWQADPAGRFAHPDDPRGSGGSGGPPGWSPGGSGGSGGPPGWSPGGSGGSGGPPGWSPGASGAGGFRGFGRSATDARGRWAIRTLKPGPVPAPDGGTEAPHLDVSVFARGLLHRLVTRIYFPDEPEANAADPVLGSIPDPQARARLVAVPDGDGLRFDIRLQGDQETPFLAI